MPSDETLKSAAAEAYRNRLRKVLAHIDAHLDESLTLERLSGIAAFSKYHFHRQFAALFGLGVHKYVQLARLRRAAYQLAFRENLRVIEIALASGYESHEAFSRAFKKTVGQTPTQFRDKPQWEAWHGTYQHVTELRMKHEMPNELERTVTIVDFAQTRVAAVEHRGDPRTIGSSVRKLIDWRKQHNLPPRLSATFNILYDDPAATPPEAFRLDLCAATNLPIADNPLGVVSKVIPGGRCAVLRHVGSDDTLGVSVRALYSSWLPTSGEEPRDFPLFVQRIRFFPDVPEPEAITDIFLPLV